MLPTMSPMFSFWVCLLRPVVPTSTPLKHSLLLTVSLQQLLLRVEYVKCQLNTQFLKVVYWKWVKDVISFLHAPCHSCPGLSEAQEDQKMLHVLRSNKRVTVAQITGKPQEAHTAGPVKKLMDSSQSHLSIRAICDIHKRMQAAWGSGQCSAAITLWNVPSS